VPSHRKPELSETRRGAREPERPGERARHLVAAGPTKRRRAHPDIVVESDLPRLAGILPWERELLVPIVEQLVDEVLGEDRSAEQVPGSEPHAKDRDQDR
jgi:hypothetical protein